VKKSKGIKTWKVGSRWSNEGYSDTSILDIFRKYNLVFVGEAPDSIFSVKIGDLVAIGDGNTIVSVGIATGLPKPITEMMSVFEEEDRNSERFGIEDSVTAFNVVLFDLERKDIFEYPSRQKFHSAGGNYTKKIEDLVFEKFIYFSESHYQNSPKPFAIKQFKISNYQGIDNIHLTDIPVDAQLIFLTGENGFGKTSILQAIVIGLFGNQDGDKLLDKTEKIKSLIELNSQDKFEIQYSLSQSINTFNCFVAYGAARLNKNARTNFPLKTHSLFNTYGELLDIEDKMIMWEKDKNQKKYFNATKEILLKLMSPYVDDLKVERIGSKTDIVYKETDCIGYKPFNELASGFKSIIAIIGDLLIRLSEEQPLIDNFEELAGIVIIDEFDLHLHPKMQKDLVSRLSETFKNIQFIVSTHSPIPLLGAPPGKTVILNVNRTKEEGITIKRLTKLETELKYLTTNQLLTSDVFGLEEVENIHLEEEEFDKVSLENDYKDIEKEEKLIKDLEKRAKNKELFPDDLFNDKKK